MSTHLPVLLDEVLAALRPVDGGVYLDGTFGGGGYAAAPRFSLVTRRAVRPTAAETERNPRARSARLRAIERNRDTAPRLERHA